MKEFISKEEFKKMREADEETGRKLMNEVLSRLCNYSNEAMVRMFPDLVSRMVKNTTATQAMTKEFYEKNPDLKDHKDIVTSVVQDVDSRYPELDYGEMLKKAEPIVREKIKNMKLSKDLPCDLPEKVNLKRNGVI